MSKTHLSNYQFVQDTSGKLAFPLTNDYLFRAMLQTSPAALRGLVAALMGMDVEDIYSCEITNPIVLGESINDKYSILDIRLVLNDYEKINLELQVVREEAWPERSLYYLSKMYADLAKGQQYDEIKPAVHIGILNFTPFPESPEFFSEYLMKNTKNNQVYSRKFSIRVLDLTQIDRVGEDEKQSALYAWAKLFKAKEWEEVQELAKEYQEICEAAAAMKTLTAEEKIKQQCWDRDLYYHEKATQEAKKRRIDEAEKRVEAKKRDLAETKKQVEAKKRDLAETKKQVEAKKRDLAETKKQVEEKTKRLEEGTKRLEEGTKRLQERENLLNKKMVLFQLLARDQRFGDLAQLADSSEQGFPLLEKLIAEYNL